VNSWVEALRNTNLAKHQEQHETADKKTPFPNPYG
jgi:hypothetical protein